MMTVIKYKCSDCNSKMTDWESEKYEHHFMTAKVTNKPRCKKCYRIYWDKQATTRFSKAIY